MIHSFSRCRLGGKRHGLYWHQIPRPEWQVSSGPQLRSGQERDPDAQTARARVEHGPLRRHVTPAARRPRLLPHLQRHPRPRVLDDGVEGEGGSG